LDQAQIRFYKKSDLDVNKPDLMYIFAIREDWRYYSSVDDLISDSETMTQGPRWIKKAAVNGHPAALATPSASYYYYKVPIGNRVIGVDYVPKDLSKDERALADKMFQSVTFTEEDDLKTPAIEKCYE
jgi:hypothetical protein